ncbi:MAG: hypothetical protein JO100_04940 [Pseudonocardia sp.]|nr:hypothetical protein [Pseudonocardia sp.]
MPACRLPRRRARTVGLVTALVVMLLTCLTARVSPEGRLAVSLTAGPGLPVGVPDPPPGTNQLITVLAPSPGSTTATLQAWQRAPTGGWHSVQGPLRALVGSDGVGRASETSQRTPAGMFSLTRAFGRAANPGTRLPYRVVGVNDWWVSDARSPAYNTPQTCRPGTCSFDESAGENLGQAGPSYDYAVVIDYNTTNPIPGAGSAFFLHVDAGAGSAGCVELPRTAVVALLRWLDPAQRPRISIGVS